MFLTYTFSRSPGLHLLIIHPVTDYRATEEGEGEVKRGDVKKKNKEERRK